MRTALSTAGILNPASWLRCFVGCGLLLCCQLPAPAQDAAPKIAGHGVPINVAIYTPDQRYLATAGADQLIKLWDAKTGEEVRTLAGHTAQVLGLAVSPDGSTIVSAAGDNTLRVWDFPRPDPLRTFAGHTAAVRAVAVSPDGKWAVTVGDDKSARVWDMADGKTVATHADHAAEATVVAVRNDNNQVASADAAGEIRLWSPYEGTLQGVLGAHTGRVTGLVFHPNNQQLVSAGADGTWKYWQLPLPLPRLLEGHAAPVRAVAVTSNGQLTVTGSEDTVRVFALPGGQFVRELPGAVGATSAVAITPNIAVAAAAGDAGVVKLWNLADGADRLQLIGHDGAVGALAFHPDNARLASAGADGTIRLWRLPVPAVSLAGHTADVTAIAVSANGQFAATVSADKTARLWNPANGQALRQLAGPQQPLTAVAFRADSAQLAAADALGEVRFWNPADGAEQGNLGAHAAAVRAMAYHPAGDQLATVGDDGCLKLWKLPLPPAKALAGHTDAVVAVALTADGKMVLTGSTDKTLRSFDAASGQQTRQFEGVPDAVTALALSADDSVTAVGAANGVIKLWNTADGTPWKGPAPAAADPNAPPVPSELIGHTGAVADLAFDAERKRIVSAGADGTLRLWRMPAAPTLLAKDAGPWTAFVVSADGKHCASAGTFQERPAILVRELTSGKIFATLLGHEAPVAVIAFSRDGTKLVSGSADKTARVWNLADSKFPELQKIVHPSAVTAVALHDEATEVFTAAADNTIRAWSVAAGTELRAFPGHGGAVSSLHVAGATLISGSADGTVRLWTIATGAAVLAINHAAAVTSVTADDAGKLIASAGADKLIKLWNVADGAAVATLTGHDAAAAGLRFQSDGSRLASAAGNSVWLWDVAGRRRLEAFVLPQAELRGVGFAGDVVAAGFASGAVQLLAPHLQQVIDAHAGGAACVAWTPDGSRLVSGGADKTLKLWNVSDGKPLATFAGPTDALTCVAVTPDGKRVVAGGLDKTVRVWPVPAAAAPQPVPFETEVAYAAPIRSVSLNRDGSRLAVAGDDFIVRVRSLTLGRELQRFTGHTAAVGSVALSADGNMLVSGSVDKTARISTLSLTHVGVAEPAAEKVAFLPDGSRLITCGTDARIATWKTTANGFEPAEQFPPAQASPEGFVAGRQVAFSVRPDGKQFAALDANGRVHVWDVAAAKLAFAIAPPKAAPMAAPPAAQNPAAPLGDVRYSPDGKQLVVGRGNLSSVFDADTGRLLQAFAEPTALTSVAFAADNRGVLVGRVGAQENAALRQVALDRLIPGHAGTVRGLAFTPDGNSLLSGGDDKLVRRWNVADGLLQRTYGGAADAVSGVRVTADSALVLAGSRDKSVRVWPLNPAADAGAAAAPQDAVPATKTWTTPAPVSDLSVSANNLLAALSGDDGVVRVLDIATGTELERFSGHAATASAVTFAPDNRTLVSTSLDKSARVWTLSVLRSVTAHAASVGDLALAAGGAQVVTVGAEGLKHWDLASGNLIRTLPGEGAALLSVAVRTDSAQAVASDADGRLLIWNFGNGQLTSKTKAPAVATQLRFAADNLKVMAACADNRVRFYNPADGLLLYELKSDRPVRAAAFAPDNRTVLTDADNDVREWRYASPAALRTLAGHGGSVYSVTYSRNGRWIASTSADQTVRTWDAATGAPAKQLTGHQGPVYSAAFSPDSALIVSCGADKSIRLFDALGGRQLKQIPASSSELYSVAFFGDGRRVAVCGLDRKVSIFDVLTGQKQQTLDKHTDFLYRVALNPAGTRLLSCGYSGNIMVWNAANGEQLFARNVGQVASFADFAPDGTRIIVAGADGRAHFVDVPANAR